MSIAYLLPQYFFIASSEALVYPAATELFAGSAVAYGLSCALQALAVGLLAALLRHLEAWIPEGSPNEGHYAARHVEASGSKGRRG